MFTTADPVVALGLDGTEIVALVGGGGKTTLMYALLRSLRASGRRVAAATTAKILPPEPSDDVELVCGDSPDMLSERLGPVLDAGGRAVCGRRVRDDGKVEGLDPTWCKELRAEGVVAGWIVEADGSARRPLKVPKEGEPPAPEGADVWVVVAGLSALDRPFDADHVFRLDRAVRVAGVDEGDPIDEAVVTRLFCADGGLLTGRPRTARAVALLNQADVGGGWDAGERISRQLIGGASAYRRVVVASVGNGRYRVFRRATRIPTSRASRRPRGL